jgi:hypothetical protein
MAITSSCTGIEHLFDSVPLSVEMENYLFLTTNEANSDDTIVGLQTLPPVGNTVIAVSGLFGLNILAARAWAAHSCGKKITTFIVIDASNTVISFWKEIAKIICGSPLGPSPAREEVIEKIEALVKANSLYYFPSDTSIFSHRETVSRELHRFRDEITSGLSFASSNEKFSLIQEIFKSRRFQALRLNFDNPASFEALGLVLKANNLITDTAYFANIECWLSSVDLQGKFLESAQALLSDSTITIDSEPSSGDTGPIESTRLHQRIQTGKLFIESRMLKQKGCSIS